jgi:hypothetical protein
MAKIAEAISGSLTTLKRKLSESRPSPGGKFRRGPRELVSGNGDGQHRAYTPSDLRQAAELAEKLELENVTSKQLWHLVEFGSEE